MQAVLKLPESCSALSALKQSFGALNQSCICGIISNNQKNHSLNFLTLPLLNTSF